MTDIQRGLYDAIVSGNIEQVNILLDRGASPNLIFHDMTPLHWAINSCYNNNNGDGNEDIYKHIVRALIDRGADITIVCHGYTPLEFAGYTQCLKLINIMKRKKI